MDVFDLSAKISLDTSKYDSGLKASESKMGAFATSLKSGLGKAAKLGGLAIGTVTAATTVLTKKFVDNANATADYGDKVDKMSQKIGISAEAYQKWDYVMQRAGTSVDNLKMGMKTLSNHANKNADEFKELGISQQELQNLNKEELFEKTIKGLAGMEEGTKRTALASKLLGRAGADLAPLLNSGTKAIEDQMKIAEDYGMVMSDKTVKASAEFKDSLTTLSMTATGLKNRLMGEFLPSLTKVTDGLAVLFTGDISGLDDINKGIDSILKKVTDAMPKILEVGASIFTKIAESLVDNAPKMTETTLSIIETLTQGFLDNLPRFIEVGVDIIKKIGSGLIDELPTLIDSVVSGVTSLMDAISENSDELIDGAIRIFEILMSSILENLPQMIDSFGEIFTNILEKITEELPDLISQIVTLIKNNLPEILQAGIELFTALVEAIPQIIPPLIDALPGIIDAIIGVLNDNLGTILDGAIKLFNAILDALPVIIDSLTDALPKIIDTIINFLIDNIDKIVDAAIKLFMAIIDAIPKVIPKIVKALPKIITKIVEGILRLSSKVLDVGVKLFQKIGEAIPKAWEWVKEKLSNFKDNIIDFFASLPEKMLNIGKDLIEGLWNGISNMAKWIKEKIEGFGKSVVNALKDFFGIKSPSKVFAEIGKNMALGLGEGWDDTIPSVEKDITRGLDFSGKTMKVENNVYTNSIEKSLAEMTNAIVTAVNESNNTTIELNSREIGRMVRTYA